jgi:hypothetical protein
MKLRNPWIDPRVAQLRPESVQAYLLCHGWKSLGPAGDPHLLRFERAEEDEDAPTVFVPLQSDDGPGLQWMIDLVGALAVWEHRFAGDVLTDILQHADGGPPNGAPPEQPRQTGATSK